MEFHGILSLPLTFGGDGLENTLHTLTVVLVNNTQML